MLNRFTNSAPWCQRPFTPQRRSVFVTSRCIRLHCNGVSEQLKGCVRGDGPTSAVGTEGSNGDFGAVDAHSASLRHVLGLSHAGQLMALGGRCPALFSFSPEALEATVEAVAGLTGLHLHQVQQLVAADPELLLQPDRLKANMLGWAQVLGVHVDRVRLMAARAPEVLALSGPAAEARRRALEAALLVDAYGYEGLLSTVLDNPRMLLVPEPQVLEARLQELEAALACVLGDMSDEADLGPAAELPGRRAGPQPAPAIGLRAQLPHQRRPQPSLAPSPGCASASVPGRAVSSRPSRVRRLMVPLVLAKPLLLNTPPQLLAGRLVHLARKAQVEPVKVLQAAPSGPNILAVNSCLFDRHCAALAPLITVPGAAAAAAAGNGAGKADAAALLVAAPSLFSQHLTAVAARWNLLVGVIGAHPRWAEWLATAAPPDRAELLNVPYVTVARLRFLVDTGVQSDVWPLDVVRPSDAAFRSQYPGFKEWLNR